MLPQAKGKWQTPYQLEQIANEEVRVAAAEQRAQRAAEGAAKQKAARAAADSRRIAAAERAKSKELDRKRYIVMIQTRWRGWALRNANAQLEEWRQYVIVLLAILQIQGAYRRFATKKRVRRVNLPSHPPSQPHVEPILCRALLRCVQLNCRCGRPGGGALLAGGAAYNVGDMGAADGLALRGTTGRGSQARDEEPVAQAATAVPQLRHQNPVNVARFFRAPHGSLLHIESCVSVLGRPVSDIWVAGELAAAVWGPAGVRGGANFSAAICQSCEHWRAACVWDAG